MTGQPLPGFRDFYPEDHSTLRSLFSAWREASRRSGFVEFEGPELEALELYTEKSGEEIIGQLYHFKDKGDREVALRPELTPTLARMVAARHRNYRKPIKWFSIPRLFRYERPQRGRHREHYQWNCDIVGEKGAAADAELIATLCLGLSLLGLGPKDVVVKISDRGWWDLFLAGQGVKEEKRAEILRILDKLEGAPTEEWKKKLGALAEPIGNALDSKIALSEGLEQVRQAVGALGYADWCEVDLRIVRGLAYYTGIVFEVHDRAGKLRAVAGGGRYDHLLKKLRPFAQKIRGRGPARHRFWHGGRRVVGASYGKKNSACRVHAACDFRGRGERGAKPCPANRRKPAAERRSGGLRPGFRQMGQATGTG
ncbi:hypothetical protein EBZ02_02245 [bacterium]|nr:hypothetical protein [bacterium]